MTAKTQPTLEEPKEETNAPEKEEPKVQEVPTPTPPPPIKKEEETKEQATSETIKQIAKVVPQVGDRGIELRNLDDLFKFGQFAIKAGLCPNSIKSAEAAALVIQAGMEIGLTPMASLQNIYVVNNKPSIYGPIGVGIAQATGKLEHYHEFFEGEYGTDAFTAICEIRRRGDSVITRKEFSVTDAKRAGLWMVNTWIKYPKDMLMYKASWRALNARFSDVLKGIQSREFAEEWVDAAKVEVIPTKPEQTRTEALADKLEQKKATVPSLV